MSWDMECDVLVLGSGGAGLVAAARAADAGAQVIVAERADLLGGTTAVSGGVVWVPNNHRMAELGVVDTPEDAWTYLRRLCGGSVDDTLIGAFVEHGPQMVRWLETQTPVRVAPIPDYPDYHPGWAGAMPGGRSLDIEPFDSNGLPPDFRWKVRRGPTTGPVTHREIKDWGLAVNYDVNLMRERARKGILTLGAALAAGLVQACLERSVTLLTGVRARRLLLDAGRIVGAETERSGAATRIGVRRGVVVATGGFEWNDDMKRQFLRGPESAPASPPFNEGDGIRMGMAIGAQLGRMNEAWWMPCLQFPGETYDGQPLYRIMLHERAYPGSLIVNRYGRRFVNECTNYCDLGRAFHVFDPALYDYPNVPAFLIFDDAYRSRYHLGSLMPGSPTPQWLAHADDPAALARQIGVDPEGLLQTLERFNRFAREGRDPDFHRGENAYDRYYGDKDNHPNPNLGSLASPPFYALPVHPGSLGTKGGLLTNAAAQVLNVWGEPIPGLYACGNAAAAATGAGYGGAGGTLGPGLTFGYLAGAHAAQR